MAFVTVLNIQHGRIGDEWAQMTPSCYNQQSRPQPPAAAAWKSSDQVKVISYLPRSTSSRSGRHTLNYTAASEQLNDQDQRQYDYSMSAIKQQQLRTETSLETASTKFLNETDNKHRYTAVDKQHTGSIEFTDQPDRSQPTTKHNVNYSDFQANCQISPVAENSADETSFSEDRSLGEEILSSENTGNDEQKLDGDEHDDHTHYHFDIDADRTERQYPYLARYDFGDCEQYKGISTDLPHVTHHAIMHNHCQQDDQPMRQRNTQHNEPGNQGHQTTLASQKKSLDDHHESVWSSTMTSDHSATSKLNWSAPNKQRGNDRYQERRALDEPPCCHHGNQTKCDSKDTPPLSNILFVGGRSGEHSQQGKLQTVTSCHQVAYCYSIKWSSAQRMSTQSNTGHQEPHDNCRPIDKQPQPADDEQNRELEVLLVAQYLRTSSGADRGGGLTHDTQHNRTTTSDKIAPTQQKCQ